MDPVASGATVPAIHTYICICIHTHRCIHTFRERAREGGGRERARDTYIHTYPSPAAASRPSGESGATVPAASNATIGRPAGRRGARPARRRRWGGQGAVSSSNAPHLGRRVGGRRSSTYRCVYKGKWGTGCVHVGCGAFPIQLVSSTRRKWSSRETSISLSAEAQWRRNEAPGKRWNRCL